MEEFHIEKNIESFRQQEFDDCKKQQLRENYESILTKSFENYSSSSNESLKDDEPALYNDHRSAVMKHLEDLDGGMTQVRLDMLREQQLELSVDPKPNYNLLICEDVVVEPMLNVSTSTHVDLCLHCEQENSESDCSNSSDTPSTQSRPDLGPAEKQPEVGGPRLDDTTLNIAAIPDLGPAEKQPEVGGPRLDDTTPNIAARPDLVPAEKQPELGGPWLDDTTPNISELNQRRCDEPINCEANVGPSPGNVEELIEPRCAQPIDQEQVVQVSNTPDSTTSRAAFRASTVSSKGEFRTLDENPLRHAYPKITHLSYEQELARYGMALRQAKSELRVQLEKQVKMDTFRKDLLEVDRMCEEELTRLKKDAERLEPLNRIAAEWERDSRQAFWYDQYTREQNQCCVQPNNMKAYVRRLVQPQTCQSEEDFQLHLVAKQTTSVLKM